MAVFAVRLSGDQIEEPIRRLREAYPGQRHFQISDRFYLIESDALAQNVAAKLGIGRNDDDPHLSVTGAVFKLNASYSGYDDRAMWEWLASTERSGD